MGFLELNWIIWNSVVDVYLYDEEIGWNGCYWFFGENVLLGVSIVLLFFLVFIMNN